MKKYILIIATLFLFLGCNNILNSKWIDGSISPELDLTPPEAPILEVPDNLHYSDNGQLDITISGEKDSTASYSATGKVDGEFLDGKESLSSEGLVDLTLDLLAFDDGEIVIQVQLIDSAGNGSEWSSHSVIKNTQDQTPPTISEAPEVEVITLGSIVTVDIEDNFSFEAPDEDFVAVYKYNIVVRNSSTSEYINQWVECTLGETGVEAQSYDIDVISLLDSGSNDLIIQVMVADYAQNLAILEDGSPGSSTPVSHTIDI